MSPEKSFEQSLLCQVDPIRVFPRRNAWTPTDSLSFVGEPPLFRPFDRPVYISCTFTWDIPEAERLYQAWSQYYSSVQIGGPAFGSPVSEFVAGRFIKSGVTFTSRGCNNRCGFCFVPDREGKISELPIVAGRIIQDNNFFQCSVNHQLAVFAMLSKQKQVIFAGGLQSSLLEPWHVDQFKKLRLKELWFACDSDSSLKSLSRAATLLSDISTEKKRCYVLIGNDSLADSEYRLKEVFKLGFLPFAQLFQPESPVVYSQPWRDLARLWSRPAAYRTHMKPLSVFSAPQLSLFSGVAHAA